MTVDGKLLSRQDLDAVFAFIGHCACGQDVSMSDARLELVTVCGRCGRVFSYCVEMGLADYNVDFQEVYEEALADENSPLHNSAN